MGPISVSLMELSLADGSTALRLILQPEIFTVDLPWLLKIEIRVWFLQDYGSIMIHFYVFRLPKGVGHGGGVVIVGELRLSSCQVDKDTLARVSLLSVQEHVRPAHHYPST